MVELVKLGPREAPAFAAMTFPAYTHMLELMPTVRDPRGGDTVQIQPLVIGAVESGRAVGLAVGELPMVTGMMPELLSLFVAPDSRQRGIGTALVERFAAEVAGAGFTYVRAIYMTGKAGIPFVEKIFAKSGWEPPATRMVSVRFAMDRMSDAAWVTRYRLGPEFEIFPWAELQDEEMEQIRQSNLETPWIKADLLPWDQVIMGFERETSLGVRRHGVVVGWVINHAISPEILRFTCSFIRRPFGKLGKIVPVYGESFQRARQAGFQTAHFTTPLDHVGMAAFAKRWIAPWSFFVGETRGTMKRLHNS